MIERICRRGPNRDMPPIIEHLTIEDVARASNYVLSHVGAQFPSHSG